MVAIAVAAEPNGIRPAGDPMNTEQHTLPAGVAITAGQLVRIDGTTGRFVIADSGAAGTARAYGVALRTVAAGYAVTAVRRGRISGYVVDAMAYNDPVYLNPTGALGTAAGTVTEIVGRVIPAWTANLGVAPDKLVEIDIRA